MRKLTLYVLTLALVAAFAGSVGLGHASADSHGEGYYACHKIGKSFDKKLKPLKEGKSCKKQHELVWVDEDGTVSTELPGGSFVPETVVVESSSTPETELVSIPESVVSIDSDELVPETELTATPEPVTEVEPTSTPEPVVLVSEVTLEAATEAAAIRASQGISMAPQQIVPGCVNSGLSFYGNYLPGKVFNNLEMGMANFEAAMLVDAKFKNSDLCAANFTYAHLKLADFSGANLTGAIFVDATVHYVTWQGTTCPDGTNSDDNGGTCVGHLN